jgi:hypothetical protein
MEELTGIKQQALSRLENPYYGKSTLTTLKRIAAAHDVGLLVEFVPFSELVNRVSGTPYIERGFSPETMNVPSFEEEEKLGTLTTATPTQVRLAAQSASQTDISAFYRPAKTVPRTPQIRDTSWISTKVLCVLGAGASPIWPRATFVGRENFVFNKADWYSIENKESVEKSPEKEIPIWMLAASQAAERRTDIND